MKKKLIILLIVSYGLFLFFPKSPVKYSLTSVFKMSDEPVAITRGTFGSVLTVNISFGDKEIEEWIGELKKPYPLLFVDANWASRYPNTVRFINEKKIPVGLLGEKGVHYEEDAALLVTQLEQFERFFGVKPLWFRTADEVFPHFLHTLLWEVELNALGSSVQWKGGELPIEKEGDIISVPHHREERVSLVELDKLKESRKFQTIEDNLFGTKVKMKKIPE